MMLCRKADMCIITFKTMTAAQRARGALSHGGVSSEVVNVDPNITKRGCQYALSLPSHDRGAALRILDAKNISYGAVLG